LNEYGLSVRQVREATGVGKTAVSEYVSRAKVIGITWPIPPEISDAELERPKTNDPSNDAANAQHGTQIPAGDSGAATMLTSTRCLPFSRLKGCPS
jgi:hypothetical protein